MNEKEKRERSGSLKTKGFYAALYSSVGAMLVLALIIGYNNFKKQPEEVYEAPDLGYAALPTLEPDFLSEGAEVSFNNATPYPREDNPESDLDNLTADTIDSRYIPPLEFTGTHGENATDDPAGTELAAGEEANVDSEDQNESDGLEVFWRKPSTEPTPEPTTEPVPSPTPKEEPFRSFNDQTDTMAWPVLGDVVMNYSADHLIYDKTLEQYRVNTNICIGGQEGAPVNAAASGVVTEIFNTRENGRTVVVDHGNGWITTYSQLKDDISVRVGDVVNPGQTIASIGSPSIFSSQLGAHLAFAVYKDNVPVDPNKVLK